MPGGFGLLLGWNCHAFTEAAGPLFPTEYLRLLEPARLSVTNSPSYGAYKRNTIPPLPSMASSAF